MSAKRGIWKGVFGAVLGLIALNRVLLAADPPAKDAAKSPAVLAALPAKDPAKSPAVLADPPVKDAIKSPAMPKESPFVEETAPKPLPPAVTPPPVLPGDTSVIPNLAPSAACCDCDCFCGPEGRVWFRADYLLFWTKPQRVPPLATTSPVGTPQAEAGVLGFPNTAVLFGGDRVDVGTQEGAQITFGGWLDRCHLWGLEGDYMDLAEETTGFHSGPVSGSQVLARPFFDVDNGGAPASQLVAFPLNPNAPGTAVTGVLNIDLSTYFQSAGLHVRRNLWSEDWAAADCEPRGHFRGFRLDGIAGYRFYRLQDQLTIHQTSAVITPANAAGAALEQIDSFATENEFQGAELGLIANLYRGRWTIGVTAKAAVGGNHRIVHINGGTVFTPLGGPSEVTAGGLLAQASNIGDYYRDQFTVIPEFETEIGFQVNRQLRAFVGYDILYWNKVARAGEQVDLNVSFLPGATRPAFPFNESSLWVQGVRLGAELSF